MRSAVVLAVLLALAPVAPLAPLARADCATDADALRSHLAEQAPRARRWNIAWAIAFGVAAGGQFALAMTKTKPFGTFDRDDEETLYVGGVKATVGFLARAVLPLHVELPAADPDRCVELAALRASLTKIGRAERRTFYLTHLGGLALNIAGAILLWDSRSFHVGAASFLLGLPVGPLSAYTMPRASWHRWRDDAPSWSLALARQPDGWAVVVGGGF